MWRAEAKPLEEQVVEALRKRGLKVALAESCTGGLVCAALTRVPGASGVLLGGVVTYADEVKVRQLDVDAKLLEEKGAVSQEVAQAMARGVRARFGCDVALSVTGFAGPDVPAGGVRGEVYLGLEGPGVSLVERHHFDGDRETVRRQAVDAGLRMLLAAAQRKR